MAGVNAHLTKSILQCGPSDDGQYGLMGFRRVRPDNRGDDTIWIGVPTALLPHLAVSAIKAIPQPTGGMTEDHPAVFALDAIQFGKGPNGELVLTLTFELGAKLSVRIDELQAHGLADGLALTLGRSDQPRPPSGSRPS